MTRRPTMRSRRAQPRAIAQSRTVPLREAILALMAAFAALAAFLNAPSASGQVFSSTPYVAAPDPAVEQLRKRVEDLEADLKRAIDRSEKLAYDLSQARKVAEEANAGRLKSEAALVSLSDRVQELEERAGIAARSDGAPLPAPSGAPGPAPTSADAAVNLNAAAPSGLANRVETSALPQDEESLLKEARNLLLDGNYPAAQQGFSAYLAKYSKSPNAHEAQYLLGESLLYQDNYTQAADAYGKLLSSYPKSPNGPNALVKLARSLRLLNKKSDACKALALMSQQFPKASDAAKQLASTERQRSNCK